MCSREDDPTQHDTRQVLRPGTCKHPGLSDERVLAYHDAPSGLQQPLYCDKIRPEGRVGAWVCGYWYTVADEDDDVIMVDEPPGAGA
jgi:hypothetical protein